MADEFEEMVKAGLAQGGLKKFLEAGARRQMEWAEQQAGKEVAKRGGATAARRLAGQAVNFLRQAGARMGGSVARLATVAGQALVRVGGAIAGVVTSEAFITAVAVCIAIIAVAMLASFLWSAITQHNQEIQRQQHEELDRSTTKLLQGFNDSMKDKCMCHGGRRASAFVGTGGMIAAANVPMNFCAWPHCSASGAA